MHKCKSKRIKVISTRSNIKRTSRRTSVKLKKLYQIEFNDFACSLITSIRAEDVSEFPFRYVAIKAGLQAAFEVGEKHHIKYAFSTQAVSVLAHDWLTTCAMYGLIAPCQEGFRIRILFNSVESAKHHIDHLLSQMRMRIADVGIFRLMAQAYIEAYKEAEQESRRRYISVNQYMESKSEYP